MAKSLGPLEQILDVGPGDGTYYDLLHPHFPLAIFQAIEIFAPYVERYRLVEKYKTVVIADAADDIFFYTTAFDLAIFGDVLEHMEKARAIQMVNRIPWKHALVSTPIVPFPQEGSLENPYEAHVAQWTTKEMLVTFHVEQYWEGSEIGVFLLRP